MLFALPDPDFKKETTMSECTDSEGDGRAITAVIQEYLDGGRTGDPAVMQRAFRENATVHGYLGGVLVAGPIRLVLDWVGENPPASDLIARIAGIDSAGTVATARVEISGWHGHRFTDQFTLLKEDGAWTITAKVFHTHEES